ncbi:MAG TPA: CAP domain-containing protein [Gemmatimonadaceae bacterium]
MRTWKLAAAVAAPMMPAACTVPVTPPAPPASPAATTGTSRYSATESQIFDLINAERRQQGLHPLVFNAQLDRMAKIQAENMARFQKMAHTLPESNLPTLAARAKYVGYAYGQIEENVALGYPNAETVVQGWMNSAGHRRNILDRGVVETGIGIARSAAGGLYYCQVFGRRLTSL